MDVYVARDGDLVRRARRSRFFGSHQHSLLFSSTRAWLSSDDSRLHKITHTAVLAKMGTPPDAEIPEGAYSRE
jgi:hypothetical protein